MAEYTIRPTSYIGGQNYPFGGGAGEVGSANGYGAVGDNSDASYKYYTPATSNGDYRIEHYGLAAPSIPSDEVVAIVQGYIRAKSVATTGSWVSCWLSRSSEALPTGGGILSLQSGSPGIFQDMTPGFNPVTWSNSEVSTLRASAYVKGGTNGTQYQWSEVFARVRTLKPIAPTATTVTHTASSFPPLNVTLNVGTDMTWETNATYQTYYPYYATILVETQIESGGTGVGTGTLVARHIRSELVTSNATFTTTGRQGTVAIANGTYKVYHRTHRLRSATTITSTGTSDVDAALANIGNTAISSWSTGYTLTMNAPQPNAPIISLIADQYQDGVEINITAPSLGTFTNYKLYIRRVYDEDAIQSGYNAGTPVRFAEGISATAGTIYDFEMPRGWPLTYLAYYEATNTSGIVIQSPIASATGVTIWQQDWNLKCPEDPNLNGYDINIIGAVNEELTEDMGVFRPLDRRLPVTVSGSLGGWDGEITWLIVGAGEWLYYLQILESQKVLLLESPFEGAKYIRIVGGVQVSLTGSSPLPRRTVRFKYVQVGRP